MSIKIMSAVWDHSPYDGKGLLIHLALADFADDQGLCWPSQASIARKARCTERYVRDFTKRMVDDKLLYIEQESNGIKAHTYRLAPPRNSVPLRNSTTPTPELGDHLTGTRPPKNRHKPLEPPLRDVNAQKVDCPYCHKRFTKGKPHDCSAMNQLIR